MGTDVASIRQKGKKKIKIKKILYIISVILLVLAIVLVKLTLLGWRWIETELDQMKRVKYKTGDLLIDKTVIEIGRASCRERV